MHFCDQSVHYEPILYNISWSQQHIRMLAPPRSMVFLNWNYKLRTKRTLLDSCVFDSLPTHPSVNATIQPLFALLSVDDQYTAEAICVPPIADRAELISDLYT